MRTLLSLVLLLAACRKPVEEPSAAAPDPQAPSAAEEAPPEELAHVDLIDGSPPLIRLDGRGIEPSQQDQQQPPKPPPAAPDAIVAPMEAEPCSPCSYTDFATFPAQPAQAVSPAAQNMALSHPEMTE